MVNQAQSPAAICSSCCRAGVCLPSAGPTVLMFTASAARWDGAGPELPLYLCDGIFSQSKDAEGGCRGCLKPLVSASLQGGQGLPLRGLRARLSTALCCVSEMQQDRSQVLSFQGTRALKIHPVSLIAYSVPLYAIAAFNTA